MKRVVCQKCRFYFVTWEKNKPHGCKAFNFKSKQMPSMAVFQSSGSPCTMYQVKFNNI